MAGWLRGLRAQSAFRRRDSWLLSAAVVCLLAAGAFLVGMRAVPVTDRDEPRFAQASRQMAEGERLADWIVPKVGDELRLKKPPLIYWLQAPTVLAMTGGDPSRDAIWMYRLPSAVAALVAALATLWLGRRMFGGNAGLLAACLLVVSPVIVTDCHMARADEVLLATTTLAMCVLWTLWSDHRAGRVPGFGRTVLFWLCVGLGILAKGPITPFVAGTCALGCAAARREWMFVWRLRPFTGLAVLAAIAVPWVWLAGNEVGWDTLRAAFDKEVLQRAKEGAEGHAAPPGYYLVTLMAFFFPGALLAALGFERVIKRAFAVRHAPGAGFVARVRARLGSARGRDAEVFLFFWIVPTWIAFELIVTKFPHYVLPVYPALALAVARLALGGVRALPKPLNAGDRFTAGAWLVVGLVLSLAGLGLHVALEATGRTAETAGAWPAMAASGWGAEALAPARVLGFVLAFLATAAACALIVAAWRAAVRGALARALMVAVPATALAEMALFGVWLPNTAWVWNTPRIVGVVARDSGRLPSDADFPRIAGVGYQEDSLLWTTRNRLDRLGDAVTGANRAAIEDWCRGNPGGYLLIPRRNVGEFAAYGTVVDELHGFNYSDGDPVVHAVLRVHR
ncbi:MAG: ArnT family glycosyltransferase [Phycisphaerales bacterium]